MGEVLIVGFDLAVGHGLGDFLHDAKPALAGQLNEHAAIAGILKGCDAPHASDFIERRVFAIRLRGLFGLDHADEAVGGERVVDHSEVARLENDERQSSPGQKQRARERKNRDNLRQLIVRHRLRHCFSLAYISGLEIGAERGHNRLIERA